MNASLGEASNSQSCPHCQLYQASHEEDLPQRHQAPLEYVASRYGGHAHGQDDDQVVVLATLPIQSLSVLRWRRVVLNTQDIPLQPWLKKTRTRVQMPHSACDTPT